jgi:riboflavin biosynthesis pyrimidine reductase
VRRLLPTAADEVDAEQEYAVPAGTPWLRANMVATVDGSVTDVKGLSGGISGEADRRVFRVLRTLADAVLVGARTAEIEGYRRAAVPMVLLTRSLALDLTAPLLATSGDEGRAGVVVIAPASASAPRRLALLEQADRVGGIELLTAGDDDLDLAAALGLLRGRGLSHLLCEGGPSLLAGLVTADLVDELCVTTSPYVVGGPAGRIVHGAPFQGAGPWTLDGLCEEEQFLFARWHRPS